MTCPKDESLVLFADAATESADDLVSSHLHTCPACAERVRDLHSSIAAWRSSDLLDTGSYSDSYFASMAMELERDLDLGDSAASSRLVPGPTAWWRRPPSLVAALSAGLLLAVGLLRSPEEPSVASEEGLPAAETAALEVMARELGRSLLGTGEDLETQDEEGAATFLASWNLSQYELLDEFSPLPLTTTLADEFDLLDDNEINSLITRL